MALPSTGSVSLLDVKNEIGSMATSLSLLNSDARDLLNDTSGDISLLSGLGKSWKWTNEYSNTMSNIAGYITGTYRNETYQLAISSDSATLYVIKYSLSGQVLWQRAIKYYQSSVYYTFSNPSIVLVSSSSRTVAICANITSPSLPSSPYVLMFYLDNAGATQSGKYATPGLNQSYVTLPKLATSTYSVGSGTPNAGLCVFGYKYSGSTIIGMLADHFSQFGEQLLIAYSGSQISVIDASQYSNALNICYKSSVDSSSFVNSRSGSSLVSSTSVWLNKIDSTSVTSIFTSVTAGVYSVYIAGTPLTGGGVSTTSGTLVAKFDNSGNLLWSRRLLTGLSTNPIITGDNTGDVYVAARAWDNTVGYVTHITKYNSSGVIQWQRKIATAYSNASSPFESVKITSMTAPKYTDLSTVIYATATIMTSTGLKQATFKISANGTITGTYGNLIFSSSTISDEAITPTITSITSGNYPSALTVSSATSFQTNSATSYIENTSSSDITFTRTAI